MVYHLLFGLSADPPHEGHRQLLTAVIPALARHGRPVAELVLMPVYQRHATGDIVKASLPSSYERRVRLCWGLATAVAAQLPATTVKVWVSELERSLAQQRGGPNYTLETVLALKEQDPSINWLFLISSDLVTGEAPELGRWYQAETLLQAATLVVCQRVGYGVNESFLRRLAGENGRYLILDGLPPFPVIASRAIRAQLAAGVPVMRLVEKGELPAAVGAILLNADSDDGY